MEVSPDSTLHTFLVCLYFSLVDLCNTRENTKNISRILPNKDANLNARAYKEVSSKV